MSSRLLIFLIVFLAQSCSKPTESLSASVKEHEKTWTLGTNLDPSTTLILAAYDEKSHPFGSNFKYINNFMRILNDSMNDHDISKVILFSDIRPANALDEINHFPDLTIKIYNGPPTDFLQDPFEFIYSENSSDIGMVTLNSVTNSLFTDTSVTDLQYWSTSMYISVLLLMSIPVV